MSLIRVTEFLKKHGKADSVLEFDSSTATVELAAQALGTTPERIAKSIALAGDGEEGILIICAGDARIDNKKFRGEFSRKPRMLSPEQTLKATGHSVGGVCPFGVPEELPMYLDVSLKRFETIFPACGTSNTAIELTLEELETMMNDPKWIDVCKDWQ